MKSIISLLFLFSVCSALAADISTSVDQKPLKCEKPLDYAACYIRCVITGFKKAACKDNQCQCSEKFTQSNDEEPEEVAAVDLQTDLKCTTPREFYQCYKHCKDTGFYVPYCKNKKCACHGSHSNNMKPFDDAELAPNSQELCNGALCDFNCKANHFKFGWCSLAHICMCYNEF